MTKNLILLKNNFIEIPKSKNKLSNIYLGTIVSNLLNFGYALSIKAIKQLSTLNEEEAGILWSSIEKSLQEITGSNRNMEKFVVYKNFPEEVLKKSEAEYWISQILMYIGLPNEFFTEEEKPRESVLENLSLKILHLSDDKTLSTILNSNLQLPAKWIPEQETIVNFLVQSEKIIIDIKKIVFKENLIKFILSNPDVKLTSAMDVLRLAVGLSNGDISLKEKSKFKNFSRKERRILLNLLEKSSNLEEDVARDKSKWKKLLYKLHPGDYLTKFPNVNFVYNKLYNSQVESFNSQIDKYSSAKNVAALKLLQSRPGEFVRKLNRMISIFDKDVVKYFVLILPKLKISQLLKIEKYLETINSRKFLAFAPKGSWKKLQIVENKNFISEEIKSELLNEIKNVLTIKLSKKLKSVNLSENAKMVKIQTNDSELASYGRGTTFPIPDNIKFIRSASYWQAKSFGYGNIWFDNGWNFFDKDWKVLGTCCWNVERFNNLRNSEKDGSIFSGDPTNSKDLKGRACQMIDLYIDELVKSGVRYAVWNILCYSKVSFNKADDVFASLQWGEEPQKGRLFEPKRAQLSFPIKGDNLAKYIAYIDLVERKLVYIDANFSAHVNSAQSNEKILEKNMPAFVEYLDTIPSVFDLFKNVKNNKSGVPVFYSDKDIIIKNKEAFVFKPENDANNFNQINVSEYLNL